MKDQYLEQMKFYADTPKGEKNKLFCFQCSILKYEEFFYRFMLRGFTIRSAWYHSTDTKTGKGIQSQFTREQLQNIFDKAMNLPANEKERIKAYTLKKNDSH